jgi:hypothetical protein
LNPDFLDECRHGRARPGHPRLRFKYQEKLMPNGKHGDHPYTDIVIHGRDVYSPRAASLVREIAKLSDDKARRGLADLLWSEYNEFDHPDVSKLETVLAGMRDRLLQEARERGFDV